jgi:hypothetical protein
MYFNMDRGNGDRGSRRTMPSRLLPQTHQVSSHSLCFVCVCFTPCVCVCCVSHTYTHTGFTHTHQRAFPVWCRWRCRCRCGWRCRCRCRYRCACCVTTMALECKVCMPRVALFTPSLIQQWNSRRYACIYASLCRQLLEPTTFVCVCVCVCVCGQRQRTAGTSSRPSRRQRKGSPGKRERGDRRVLVLACIQWPVCILI